MKDGKARAVVLLLALSVALGAGACAHERDRGAPPSAARPIDEPIPVWAGPSAVPPLTEAERSCGLVRDGGDNEFARLRLQADRSDSGARAQATQCLRRTGSGFARLMSIALVNDLANEGDQCRALAELRDVLSWEAAAGSLRPDEEGGFDRWLATHDNHFINFLPGLTERLFAGRATCPATGESDPLIEGVHAALLRRNRSRFGRP